MPSRSDISRQKHSLQLKFVTFVAFVALPARPALPIVRKEGAEEPVYTKTKTWVVVPQYLALIAIASALEYLLTSSNTPAIVIIIFKTFYWIIINTVSFFIILITLSKSMTKRPVIDFMHSILKYSHISTPAM
jgi:hypothetical protein